MLWNNAETIIADMLNLYDSLTKALKPFPEQETGPVTIYACGPTVYHYVHIGNLRTFLTVDLFRRYLEHKGREVKLVMNITDVGHMLNDADVGEDKMEAAAAKEGKTPEEIARYYEEAFFSDLKKLNFKKEGTTFPRATEHIPQMIALVEKLIADGKAYVTANNDVYYSVASFPEYGKLSGNTVDNLVAGARVEVKQDKRHPADFALWIHNPNHVMQWKGPQGIQGYPGWHIECSAMAKAYLGDTIDLHIGGEDLKFPHHECEIAQSEGANGVTFARQWLHVTYLLVDGEKMSKSKGNFYTLGHLTTGDHRPAALRLLLLSAHYRTQFNFTFDGLITADNVLTYFQELLQRLNQVAGDITVPAATDLLEAFDAAMDSDLNVSEAIAVVRDVAKSANRDLDGGVMSAETAASVAAFIRTTIGGVFGIDLNASLDVVPDDVVRLKNERERARRDKNFADSDRLRDEIAAKGWIVEDTPQGQKLKKA